MEKYAVWFGLLLKKNLKKKTVYIQSVVLIMLLLFLQLIHIPNSDNTKIGICLNDNDVAKIIYDYLIRNEIKVKSITVDNGLEFQALGLTAKKLGVKLYKCDPYCSFQRGTNERYNALVRRFIPKGNSLIRIEQQYLDDICFKINEMPRKMFDFKTPHDIEFEKETKWCG